MFKTILLLVPALLTVVYVSEANAAEKPVAPHGM